MNANPKGKQAPVTVKVSRRFKAPAERVFDAEPADEHAVGWERFLGWLTAYLNPELRH
jgi:uncharacterized protein YndB with AHSA1/START domain